MRNVRDGRLYLSESKREEGIKFNDRLVQRNDKPEEAKNKSEIPFATKLNKVKLSLTVWLNPNISGIKI